jgi:hypothetical protein
MKQELVNHGVKDKVEVLDMSCLEVMGLWGKKAEEACKLEAPVSRAVSYLSLAPLPTMIHTHHQAIYG